MVSQVRLFDSRLADPFQSVVEVGDWSTLSGGVITNRGYLQNIEKPIEKPPI